MEMVKLNRIYFFLALHYLGDFLVRLPFDVTNKARVQLQRLA